MTYQLPAEWALQSAVLLSWPHPQSDWADLLDRAEQTYQDIVRAIIRFQHVIIVCHDESLASRVKNLFRDEPQYHRIIVRTTAINDTWTRDYGPLTVLNPEGQARLLDFQFNGWGNKFDARLDNQAILNLHQQGLFGTTPIQTLPLVMEGGSVESDGQGIVLTTRHCLLSKERNPQLSEPAIEAELKQHLGCQHVLWLNHGQLEGDDTDGHIDTLVRICSPDTLCYVQCDDKNDSHYDELLKMKQELQQLRKPDGSAYKLIPLPWPSAKYDQSGRRLPATYANFLIINDAVLLPVYDDPNDVRAIAALQLCFPEREIIPINCLSLIEQSGSLHCITMQIPHGVIIQGA